MRKFTQFLSALSQPVIFLSISWGGMFFKLYQTQLISGGQTLMDPCSIQPWPADGIANKFDKPPHPFFVYDLDKAVMVK